MKKMKATYIFFFSMLIIPLYSDSFQTNSDSTITITEKGIALLGDKTKSQTKEAAKADAIRKAVERVAGAHISSNTKVRNYILQSDEINVSSSAFVRSIKEVSYNYDKLTETGTFTGEFIIAIHDLTDFAEASIKSDQLSNINKNKDIQIYFALYDSANKRIKEGDIVHNSDQYQIMVQPFQECYLYIVNKDASGAVYNLFPNENIQTNNPLIAGKEYYFPDTDYMYAFDEINGIENYYILASYNPIHDINVLFRQIKDSKDSDAAMKYAATVEAQMKNKASRGGGQIVNKYSGVILEIKNKNNNEILVENLKSKGIIMRHIYIDHQE